MNANSDSVLSGRVGYEYDYRFSIVDADEISSVYKFFLDPKLKYFLFEFRTSFILKSKTDEGKHDLTDSERYDLRVPQIGGDLSIYFRTYRRLDDYWMTEDEMKLLSSEAFDFAKQMAAKPEHALLNLIPIAVEIDVCTVQQEAETYDACLGRAIRPQNMVPLYLWVSFTSVEERKPMTPRLITFLLHLPRIRVEDIEKGLALMEECSICSEMTKVGAQISVLQCGHAFHSHCVVGWLEDNRLCPTCKSPAYERRFDYGPPFKRLRPCDG
ncbi:hypothetical protein CASFOL_014635 [Castilleja foliolosa]|uniref:RING-type domain-containing protein n=1 Tax=Castilleja foliolosa TaxID=1961234 RepID=A0ABD3DD92_9LAMI